ncbi:hypothetical protein JMUB6875_40650 [Nocardia sp. JMUB6875]|uniref:hypothetical protein n=1 Tax=Nocardia sp. JMUB6875 TaxID=3158170 RepID=UPI0032E56D83
MASRYPYARRTDDGGILIPKAFHLPDGIIADGHEIVHPDDPRYAELDHILRQWDANHPDAEDAPPPQVGTFLKGRDTAAVPHGAWARIVQRLKGNRHK